MLAVTAFEVALSAPDHHWSSYHDEHHANNQVAEDYPVASDLGYAQDSYQHDYGLEYESHDHEAPVYEATGPESEDQDHDKTKGLSPKVNM